MSVTPLDRLSRLILRTGVRGRSIHVPSLSPALAFWFTRTLLTVTLTASKPHAGASVSATFREPVVAAGVGPVFWVEDEPLPPQATRDAAHSTLPANRPSRLMC